MNVRSFSRDRFLRPDENEIRQRATWYYCPQALSEYKLPFLDLLGGDGSLIKWHLVSNLMEAMRRVFLGDLTYHHRTI